MGHPALPENCDLDGVWISTQMVCSFILPNLCHMVVKMHWIPITNQLSQTFLETSAESLKTREEDKEQKQEVTRSLTQLLHQQLIYQKWVTL